MGDPPSIRILPDQAGYLLEYLVDESDNAIKAKVTWMDFANDGYGTSTEHTKWVPIGQVAELPSENYENVLRTPATALEAADNGPAPAMAAPPDWPENVPPPGVDGWEKEAVAFLFDQIPADYRAHAVLTQYPAVLAHMAKIHLQHAYRAVVRSYRKAPVDLKAHVPHHAMDELLGVYRTERDRIVRCGRAVNRIEQALRGAVPGGSTQP